MDRNSLETAAKASGWEINQYDVLPDRVVVYLWPRAGGAKFSFKFSPRFGLKALTPPSTLTTITTRKRTRRSSPRNFEWSNNAPDRKTSVNYADRLRKYPHRREIGWAQLAASGEANS